MRIPQRHPHKKSGLDRCRWKCKDYYFGPAGSEESDRKYEIWLQQILAGEPEPVTTRGVPSVELLVSLFLDMAKGRYSRGEYHNLRQASKPLLKKFRRKLASQFGPKSLIEVRELMAKAGWPRVRINEQVGRVRRIFRWGVSHELVPGITAAALRELLPLREGEECGGVVPPEAKPIRPATTDQLATVVEQLTPMLAAMVQVQAIVGTRPGDLLIMRPGDVDQSDTVWIYRPRSHKTQWRGKSLAYAIGPKAQAHLRPYLKREFDAYCFPPAQTILERRAIREAARKTKQTNQAKKRLSKSPPAVADCYNTTTYRRAIERATKRITKEDREAFLKLYFAPNRLRHTKATQLRAEHGIEAARVALGHSNISTTLIYAEADLEKAKEIALKSG